MKRDIYRTVIILILVINIGGCMSKERQLLKWFKSEQEISDERVEKIIEALKKKDAEKLKEMFSKKAILEVDNLDEQLESLIEFYSGDLVEYDGGCDSESQNRHGKKKLSIYGKYKVITTEEEYRIFFSECVKDYEEPEKIGIYNIGIVKEEVWKKEDIMWYNEKMGAYVEVGSLNASASVFASTLFGPITTTFN